MADENKSNTSPVMAFVVGGVVVAVAILAYFMFGGDEPATVGGGDTNINVETSDTGSGEGSGGSETGAETSGGTESETTGETSN